MGVKRLGVYYAFWLPIAAALIVFEITWRMILIRSLEKR